MEWGGLGWTAMIWFDCFIVRLPIITLQWSGGGLKTKELITLLLLFEAA